jgi:hypothetical protein
LIDHPPTKKREHHHGGAASPTRGMAMALIAAPPQEPLCDGLVKGSVEGINLILMTGIEKNLFS